LNAKPANIDEYLSALPEESRAMIAELRRLIKVAAPDAVEAISYGMPAFTYHGKRLLYFAAAKQHCALYGTARGTVRFPLGQPLPEALVKELVEARIADIAAEAAAPLTPSGRAPRARSGTGAPAR
jgi:uncharacterized protein YdhG (YjbR/CyaY superfamily)